MTKKKLLIEFIKSGSAERSTFTRDEGKIVGGA